ncbi:MAG: polyhydroxyalkanoate synthesis regulator DNA-binding domain-containing protein [Thermoanaerobaculia bacterium]
MNEIDTNTTRVIKRYESRKLYDTTESRYVSLEEVATFVRDGQQVQVIDNGTSDDVTTQTLTQIILEEGRSGRSVLPSSFMHDLVRKGERVVTSSVEHVQKGVGRLVKASIDRVGPLREAREEMAELRGRLDELENTLAQFDLERIDRVADPVPATEHSSKVNKSTAKKKA